MASPAEPENENLVIERTLIHQAVNRVLARLTPTTSRNLARLYATQVTGLFEKNFNILQTIEENNVSLPPNKQIGTDVYQVAFDEAVQAKMTMAEPTTVTSQPASITKL